MLSCGGFIAARPRRRAFYPCGAALAVPACRCSRKAGASLWYRWRPTEEVYQRPEGPGSAGGGCRARSSDRRAKARVLVYASVIPLCSRAHVCRRLGAFLQIRRSENHLFSRRGSARASCSVLQRAYRLSSPSWQFEDSYRVLERLLSLSDAAPFPGWAQRVCYLVRVARCLDWLRTVITQSDG